jgi:hypothetical protein
MVYRDLDHATNFVTLFCEGLLIKWSSNWWNYILNIKLSWRLHTVFQSSIKIFWKKRSFLKTADQTKILRHKF